MRKLTIALICLGIAMISAPAFSAEMQDYSKIWKAWGRDGQTAYIWGFIDGGGHAMQTVMSEIIASDKQGGKVPQNFYENIRVKTATLYDENKIIEIITNLYKDPANSYILFQDMVYIARDSLSGKDVTKAILDARKAAIATHELNEKMKGK
jgi:hypothetical protein